MSNQGGGLWWMSFVDPAKSAPPGAQVPGGGGFLGVVITEAATIEDAITGTHLLGINPGGEISIAGPMPTWAVSAEWRDRLLTADEANAIPDPNGAPCPEGPHRGPEGPNEDIAQCTTCWSVSYEMRPEGETYGDHLPDCSLARRHESYCRPGGAGHSTAPTIRGYWPDRAGAPER